MHVMHNRMFSESNTCPQEVVIPQGVCETMFCILLVRAVVAMISLQGRRLGWIRC